MKRIHQHSRPTQSFRYAVSVAPHARACAARRCVRRVCCCQRGRCAPFGVVLAIAGTTLALLGLHQQRLALYFAYVAIASLVAALVCGALSCDRGRRGFCGLALVGAVFGVLGSLVFPFPVVLSKVHSEYRTIGCITARLGGVDCRVFYPSSLVAATFDAKHRVPYVFHDNHLARGLSLASHAPQWFFYTLNTASLAAINNAPIATPTNPRGWPLVVFSHGLGGTFEIYATIVQELASRGIVVVVRNHCDGSASVTRHKDGQYATIEAPPQGDSDTVVHFRQRQLRQRVTEVQSVLDEITDLRSSHDVFSAVDVRNVHVAGHSFGAATALSVALADPTAWRQGLHDPTRAWTKPQASAIHMSACQRVLAALGHKYGQDPKRPSSDADLVYDLIGVFGLAAPRSLSEPLPAL